MGLLDGLLPEDPQQKEAARMALLAASLGMLSGRGRNFGEIAGKAGLMGLGTYANQLESSRKNAQLEAESRRRDADSAMERQLKQAHLGLYGEQAAKARMEMELQRRRMAGIDADVPPWAQQPSPGFGGAQPPTPQVPPGIPLPAGVDPQQFMVPFTQAGMPVTVRDGRLYSGDSATERAATFGVKTAPVPPQTDVTKPAIDPALQEMITREQQRAMQEYELAKRMGDEKGMNAAKDRFGQALKLAQNNQYVTPSGRVYTPPRVPEGMSMQGDRMVPIPGFNDANAAIEGSKARATAAATEDEKAKRDLVTITDQSGQTRMVPRSVLLDAARGQQAPQGPVMPPQAAPQPQVPQQAPQQAPSGVPVQSPAVAAGQQTAQQETWRTYLPDLRNAANTARVQNTSLDLQLRAIERGLTTGQWGNAKASAARFFAALGVKDAERYAANADTFLAAMQEQVLNKQIAQKGPQTESDAKRMESTVASMTSQADAIKFLGSYYRALNNQQIAKAEFASQLAAQVPGMNYNDIEVAWQNAGGGRSVWDDPALAPYYDPRERKSTLTPPPQWAIDALRKNKDNPRARDDFRKRFGVPATAYLDE